MSQIDPLLQKVVCCPDTHQPLNGADQALIDDLNSRIAQGGVRNRAGGTVTEPIECGLLRQDRRVLYPVRSGIPVLLSEEAIPLDR